MIIDNIKAKIKDSMKAKDSDTVALLRLVVGSVQQDGDDSDTAVEKVIRKMIKSNNQTAEVLVNNGGSAKEVLAENALLDSFLPKSLTVDEIVAFINENAIDVTGHAGKAMGAVMKALKDAGATVQGSDVKSAIEKLNE